jgi:hypothetical protein
VRRQLDTTRYALDGFDLLLSDNEGFLALGWIDTVLGEVDR